MEAITSIFVLKTLLRSTTFFEKSFLNISGIAPLTAKLLPIYRAKMKVYISFVLSDYRQSHLERVIGIYCNNLSCCNLSNVGHPSHCTNVRLDLYPTDWIYSFDSSFIFSGFCADSCSEQSCSDP